MADVRKGKDIPIPLKIDGALRFVTGATKYTTFSDVVKMVLKKTGISKDYRHLFSMVEVTKDGEHCMCGKDRVLRRIKEWGDEPNKFVLRKNSFNVDL